jgi:hypothetical protein
LIVNPCAGTIASAAPSQEPASDSADIAEDRV